MINQIFFQVHCPKEKELSDGENMRNLSFLVPCKATVYD